VDLLRAAGKEGVLRLERDRHGAVRVFPGTKLAGAPAPVAGDDTPLDVDGEVVTLGTVAAERVEEAPILDAETVEPPVASDPDATPARKRARRRRSAAPRAKAAKVEKAAKGGENAERVVKPRTRRSARAKSEAADQT
jgi:hypothetical protein